jgi:hypothetical protein
MTREEGTRLGRNDQLLKPTEMGSGSGPSGSDVLALRFVLEQGGPPAEAARLLQLYPADCLAMMALL